jgi:hypothetical protein
MTIPYGKIRDARATELLQLFPPEEQRWTQRHFLRPIYSRTVLVLELEALPRPKTWLRLWMSKYMLSPNEVGMVIPVWEWMAFRAELDEAMARSR